MWIPRIEYNEGNGVLQPELPAGIWLVGMEPVGGHGKAASGVPETIIIRRDQLLELELRWYETELPAVWDWVTWAQDTAGLSDVYLDKDDLTSPLNVYLEGPAVGERWMPSRREGFPFVYQHRFLLRSACGSVFNVPYYPAA